MKVRKPDVGAVYVELLVQFPKLNNSYLDYGCGSGRNCSCRKFTTHEVRLRFLPSSFDLRYLRGRDPIVTNPTSTRVKVDIKTRDGFGLPLAVQDSW